MYGPRFYYEGFGFLILLTARGVDVALDLARPALTARIGREWDAEQVVRTSPARAEAIQQLRLGRVLGGIERGRIVVIDIRASDAAGGQLGGDAS